MLQELTHIPAGLLDLPAPELHSTLGGPTLIHLEGHREPALFVSVLMHGNETTGWEAVRAWLRAYRPGGGDQELQRSVSLFIGNVAAAGLTEEFLLEDLSVVGSLAGGGPLGDVDLIYVPEPAALLLALLGVLTVGLHRPQRR